MNARLDEMVAALDFHVWNPTTRLCACGLFFDATYASIAERKHHVVSEILRAHLTTCCATPDHANARPLQRIEKKGS